MPPKRTHRPPPGKHRIPRAADLPHVPVTLSGDGAAKLADAPKPVPQNEQPDDTIRRMIEAAYT